MIHRLLALAFLLCSLAPCGVPRAGAESWLVQTSQVDASQLRFSRWKSFVLGWTHIDRETGPFASAGDVEVLRRNGARVVAWVPATELTSDHPAQRSGWSDSRPAWVKLEGTGKSAVARLDPAHPDWAKQWLAPLFAQVVERRFDAVCVGFVEGQRAVEALEMTSTVPAVQPVLPTPGMIEAAARELAAASSSGAKPGLYAAVDAELLPKCDTARWPQLLQGVLAFDVMTGPKGPRPKALRDARIAILKRLKEAGVTVVLVEQLSDGRGMQGNNFVLTSEAIRLAGECGFGVYVAAAKGGLQTPSVIPGLQP